MYKYAFLILLPAMVAYMSAQVHTNPPQPMTEQPGPDTLSPDSVIPVKLLGLQDAEEIMGESVHLSDNTAEILEGKKRHLLSYTADNNAPGSERPGAVYFLYEQYTMLPSARERFTSTKLANEHLGINVLEGLGDEAYFHTDGENFYFVMVRKGNIVFNMKVNKLTATTSLEAFNAIARKIADAI